MLGDCSKQKVQRSLTVFEENNKNKLNGTYVYRHKHNYIPCSAFTITTVQLHVSAINVGHLQVVHEELINKLYQHVWGVYSLWGGVGARSRFVLDKGGMDIIPSSTQQWTVNKYIYIYIYIQCQ